jgi:hypothetical protein
MSSDINKMMAIVDDCRQFQSILNVGFVTSWKHQKVFFFFSFRSVTGGRHKKSIGNERIALLSLYSYIRTPCTRRATILYMDGRHH